MKKFKILSLALSVLVGILLLSGCTAASTTGTTGGSDTITLIVVLVLIFAVFYFLTIRPQRKRQKEQQKLIEELKRGDRIITIGGLYGTIESTDEESIVIKLESDATVRIVKSAVHHKINPG